LTVISRSSPLFMRGQKFNRWNCACSCGGSVAVVHGSLNSGNTSSCGCLRDERQRKAALKHGHTVGRRMSPEYLALVHAIQRCHNESDPGYRNYGARGISVCDEWRKSPKKFLEHIGRKPSESHSLDRIDNDKGYCPGNVRWATKKDQTRNRRKSSFVVFRGRRKHIIDWARKWNVNPRTVRVRLWRGWTIEQALTLAPRRGRKPNVAKS